jgi:hypothetical protein
VIWSSRCAGYESKFTLERYWGICTSQGLRHRWDVLSVKIGGTTLLLDDGDQINNIVRKRAGQFDDQMEMDRRRAWENITFSGTAEARLLQDQPEVD